jgi:hypothetical protein
MIAFYIHQVDMYAGMAENHHHMIPTITVSEDHREGFRDGLKNSLSKLPDEIRTPVMKYMADICPYMTRTQYIPYLELSMPYRALSCTLIYGHIFDDEDDDDEDVDDDIDE